MSMFLRLWMAFFISLSINPLFAQTSTRIVGYLPYYRFQHAPDIEFSKLTHLCIAFANPDMDGNLSVGGEDIQPIVDLAHQEQVAVLLSLAGGYLTSDWWNAWQHLTQPSNRSAFIGKIMHYLDLYNLQGVDLDLEWQYVKDWYSDFAVELADSLAHRQLLFTAALPGTYRYPLINEQALNRFDFINLMAYDLRGPWDPSNPGNHSPYSFAESSIRYWNQNQGVEKDRLTLGVPFYGYDFSNPANVRSFTYRSMVNENPAYALLDQVGQRYYNGVQTIRDKTELAIREVSGIMIWELGQDHFTEAYSLLNVIFETTNRLTTGSEFAFSNHESLVYPNPFREGFHVRNPSPDADCRFVLTDVAGKIWWNTESNTSNLYYSAQQLPKGMYFLQWINGQNKSLFKLVKS